MAISCVINKNLKKSDFCGYSLKQIVKIYLANFNDMGNVTLAEDGYTVSGVSTGATFYEVEPAKDTSSYNDDLNVGGNGSKYRTHSVTFSFNGAYSADLAAIVDELSLGKFVAVLKLSDGSAIMLGRVTGLEASAVSSLSEAAADGANGINVTLDANTTEPALPVSPAALTAIESQVYEG